MIEPRVKKHRILVVDDVAENIDILITLLKPDYMMAAARSGEKALAMVKKNPPDLILLDIKMPGMDGYEVCRRLKGDEATRLIPIIIVTELSEAMDESKAFDLGAVDYITKPFVLVVIEARVKTHLALKDYQNHLEGLVNERTRQLEEAKTVALADSMAKSNFLMNMTHELRTPLMGLVSAVEIITACDSRQELLNTQELIKSSSRSLLEMVGDILDFTGARDGELALEQKPFRLDEALSRIKTSFYHKGVLSDLQLSLDIHTEGIPNSLVGDEIRLVEVLNRIMDNASKFTENAPRAQLSILALDMSDSNAVLKFSIKDEGIGISYDDSQKIFEPFFQVETSPSGQYDGVGIGLSACKQIVELMGGTIGVFSESGQGSTFYFTAKFNRPTEDMSFDSTILCNQDSKSGTGSRAPQALDADLTKALLETLYKALIEASPNAIKASVNEIQQYDIPGIDIVIRTIRGYEYDEATAALIDIAGQLGLDLDNA